MRNIKVTLRVVAAGCCAFGLISAAHAQVDQANNIGGQVTTTLCPQLSSAITTGLSTNVQGAYVCRAADAVTGAINRVGVGTCHPGGSAKSRLTDCSWIGALDANGVMQYAYSPTTCSAANFEDAGGAPGAKLPGEAGQGLISGIALVGGSTLGGSIQSTGMASTACDAAGVKSLVQTTFQ